MKFTRTLMGRIAGVCGAILGLFLIYKKNYLGGAIILSLGIGMLMWRYKK